MLSLACIDLLKLCRTADIAAAMSVEALLGTDAAFDAAVQALRPHPGQRTSAANLTRLMADSAIVASHRENDDRVQDAYSMRCAPQVVGAARDVLEYARGVAQIELGSAVDNPSVLDDGRLVSNGNFHGIPLGFAADFMAIAAAEVGAIAERRIDRLLDVTRSMGLPAFLGESPGLDSGLMIAQYTAAALVAENRRLAAPASVDSIPTSGMQEDHVSMGWSATRKLRRTLHNLSRILAVELLCSARALVLRAPLEPAPATAAVASLRRPATRPGPQPRPGACSGRAIWWNPARSWRRRRERSERSDELTPWLSSAPLRCCDCPTTRSSDSRRRAPTSSDSSQATRDRRRADRRLRC